MELTLIQINQRNAQFNSNQKVVQIIFNKAISKAINLYKCVAMGVVIQGRTLWNDVKDILQHVSSCLKLLSPPKKIKCFQQLMGNPMLVWNAKVCQEKHEMVADNKKFGQFEVEGIPYPPITLWSCYIWHWCQWHCKCSVWNKATVKG
jgi:molecular chaperone DnaK (HSP70)